MRESLVEYKRSTYGEGVGNGIQRIYGEGFDNRIEV
jgi:hypothetical protein